MRPLRSKQRGFILIWTIMFCVMFFALIVTFANFAVNYLKSVKRSMLTLNALSLAEAGADHFMAQININGGYSGTNGTIGQGDSCSSPSAPFTVFTTSEQGKGVFETCAQPSTIANEKVVYSTGRIYYPATATNPIVTRKLRLIIRGTQQAGYTVLTGPGGLHLGANGTITSGPVAVGGKLTMDNNSAIGTAVNPVTVNVSDIACPYPANGSYPDDCGNNQGNPPYSIQLGSGAYIRGSTTAPNTISRPANLTNPGLVSSNRTPISLPTDNHDTLVAAITNSTAASNASCSGSTKTWPANTKYTGNVVINVNCQITVNGNIWITGNATIGNNATVKVAEGLTSSPYIIIDGSAGLDASNNSAFLPNSAGIGFRVITFYSWNSAGTGPNSCSPSCTTVSGAELAMSQTKITINLSNNFSSASGSTFYSRWSKVYVGNNATVGSVIGQMVDLNNNGNIIFNGSSASGSLLWDVKYYEQL